MILFFSNCPCSFDSTFARPRAAAHFHRALAPRSHYHRLNTQSILSIRLLPERKRSCPGCGELCSGLASIGCLSLQSPKSWPSTSLFAKFFAALVLPGSSVPTAQSYLPCEAWEIALHLPESPTNTFSVAKGFLFRLMNHQSENASHASARQWVGRGRMRPIRSTAEKLRTGFVIALLHVVPLTLFFTGTNRVDWLAFALVYVVMIFGVGGALHRYFAHRAFKTTRAFCPIWIT